MLDRLRKYSSLIIPFGALAVAGIAIYLFVTDAVQETRTVNALPSTVAAPPLARVKNVTGKVKVRRSGDFDWKVLAQGAPLYEYDAVQTSNGSGAELVFENKSEMALKEETLIIITPSIQSGDRAKDRAIVQKGHLEAETQGEMWLVTAAALFRLNAAQEKETATASLSVEPDKYIRVALHRGQGALLARSRPLNELKEADIQNLEIDKPIDLEIPENATDFTNPKQDVLASNDLATVFQKILPPSAPKSTPVPDIDSTPLRTVVPSPEAAPEKSVPPDPSHSPDSSVVPIESPTTSPSANVAPGPSTMPAVVASPGVDPTPSPSPSPKPTVAADIQIATPANYSETDEASTQVTGRVTAPVRHILLNGKKVPVNAKQRFSVNVPLQKGTNTLIFQTVQSDHKPKFVRWIIMRR